MSLESLTIAVVTLSPPILFLYLYTGDHEREFMHNKMMLYMAMGLILGTVFWTIERLYFALYLLIFIAFLEQLTKSIILNRKQIQGKRSAIWYGSAMGFVMGAIMVSEMMYASYVVSGIDSWSIVSFFGLASSYSALHGSTGALIGYGSYKNQLWRYLFKAYFIHVLFILILFLGLYPPLILILLLLYSMFNMVRVYRMLE